MNRRTILSISAMTTLGLALLPSSSIAQQKSLKDQLVGTWTVVSFHSFDATGAKVPNMEGRDLKGQFILTDNGRFSVQMITDFPKLASNDRMKTTPAEEKTVAHGVLSYFGTYTVTEADKSITRHLDRRRNESRQRQPHGRWQNGHGVEASEVGSTLFDLASSIRAP
jgi:hypothetical protein